MADSACPLTMKLGKRRKLEGARWTQLKYKRRAVVEFSASSGSERHCNSLAESRDEKTERVLAI